MQEKKKRELIGVVVSDKADKTITVKVETYKNCLLYTSPSPRDRCRSRMPSSA